MTKTSASEILEQWSLFKKPKKYKPDANPHLWKYLVNKLKMLNDNNKTAKLIYNKLMRDFI